MQPKVIVLKQRRHSARRNAAYAALLVALVWTAYVLALAVHVAHAQGVAVGIPPFGQGVYPGSPINAFCSQHQAILEGAVAILGTSVSASLLANLRRFFPGWLVTLLDALALNIFHILEMAALAKTAKPPAPPPAAAPPPAPPAPPLP